MKVHKIKTTLTGVVDLYDHVGFVIGSLFQREKLEEAAKANLAVVMDLAVKLRAVRYAPEKARYTLGLSLAEAAALVWCFRETMPELQRGGLLLDEVNEMERTITHPDSPWLWSNYLRRHLNLPVEGGGVGGGFGKGGVR